MKKSETERLKEFNESLPCPIKDEGLLKKVFVHRSYLNEPKGAGLESNERLEFLGDAVLSIVISDMLFRAFPEVQEGEMTQMRSRLVNKKALAGLAENLKMQDYLLLGKGEEKSGGALNPTILSCALEALLGAVYLDAGFKKSFDFIEGLFSPLIDEAREVPGHFDYKPRLQELAQRAFKASPCYRLTSESGPQHRKVFEVEVEVKGHVLGKGTATSKKEAEQVAAREALERLKHLDKI